MEIVSNSIGKLNTLSTRTTKYKMWKQSLYKWDEYIVNRHKKIKYLDEWSKHCLENLKGKCAVYNSGGLYFKDFNKEITVIEHHACPITVNGMEYVYKDFDRFDNAFDCLIMTNPISLKYHHSIWYFLTVPGHSRAGFKGNILHWLKPDATIFLSFSDWHMYYDRLKFSLHEFVDQQLEELESHGIECILKNVQPSNSDITNGNVKLTLINHAI